jgi:hypothetical protein
LREQEKIDQAYARLEARFRAVAAEQAGLRVMGLIKAWRAALCRVAGGGLMPSIGSDPVLRVSDLDGFMLPKDLPSADVRECFLERDIDVDRAVFALRRLRESLPEDQPLPDEMRAILFHELGVPSDLPGRRRRRKERYRSKAGSACGGKVVGLSGNMLKRQFGERYIAHGKCGRSHYVLLREEDGFRIDRVTPFAPGKVSRECVHSFLSDLRTGRASAIKMLMRFLSERGGFNKIVYARVND